MIIASRSVIALALPAAGLLALALVPATVPASEGTLAPSCPLDPGRGAGTPRVHELVWGQDGTLDERWEERRFFDRTRYVIVDGSSPYLAARARAAGSALYRDLEIEDARGLHLAWSWRVHRFPEGEDLRDRDGDDRAAAVTVIFNRPLLPFLIEAIFYVWSADLPEGTLVANPYSGRVKMIVLRSGTADGWQHEHRDLAADYRRAFGREIEGVAAVGVFTDTDNTGADAAADYRPLRLEFDRAHEKTPTD